METLSPSFRAVLKSLTMMSFNATAHLSSQSLKVLSSLSAADTSANVCASISICVFVCGYMCSRGCIFVIVRVCVCLCVNVCV